MIQYSSIKRFASLPSTKKLVVTIINESRKTEAIIRKVATLLLIIPCAETF